MATAVGGEVIGGADLRGHGVGTALMAGLRSWATEAGVEALWVATGGRAVALYRRCGFAVTEDVRLVDGGRLTILAARLQPT